MTGVVTYAFCLERSVELFASTIWKLEVCCMCELDALWDSRRIQHANQAKMPEGYKFDGPEINGTLTCGGRRPWTPTRLWVHWKCLHGHRWRPGCRFVCRADQLQPQRLQLLAACEGGTNPCQRFCPRRRICFLESSRDKILRRGRALHDLKVQDLPLGAMCSQEHSRCCAYINFHTAQNFSYQQLAYTMSRQGLWYLRHLACR